MTIVNLYVSCHAYTGNVSTLKGGNAVLPASIVLPSAATIGIASGLCSGLTSNLDGLLGGLGQIKSAMNDPLTNLNNEISNLEGQTATPTIDINSAAGDLTNAANDSIPDLPDVSEIDKILQDCGILNGSLLGGVPDVSSIVGDYLNQSLNSLSNIIDKTLEALSNLIEIPVVILINSINKLLNAFGIGDMIKQLDGLLNCIDAICGTDISSQAGYVDNMLNDMNINDSGNFDPNMAFADFNIPNTIVDNITSINDTVLSEVVSAEKQLVEVGKTVKVGLIESSSQQKNIKTVNVAKSFFT